MKSIMKLSLLVCTLFLLCTVTSCKHEHGPDTHTHNADGTIDKSGPEWTSDYVCPMHCKGSGSNAEGTCPVCKMKLVKNKDKAVDHSGHDHPKRVSYLLQCKPYISYHYHLFLLVRITT